MSVDLFTGRDNTGRSFSFSQNTPSLPPEISGVSESCIIDHRSIPCYFFSEPNYGGQKLTLVRGGGCDDLSTLPGNWLHKIRSVAFDRQELSAEEDSLDTAELGNSAIYNADRASELFEQNPELLNPLFATSGCHFPGNRRNATFNYEPWINFQIGMRVEVVTLQGNCSQYYCQGGQCVVTGNLTMVIDGIRHETGNPFAKVIIYGNAA